MIFLVLFRWEMTVIWSNGPMLVFVMRSDVCLS